MRVRDREVGRKGLKLGIHPPKCAEAESEKWASPNHRESVVSDYDSAVSAVVLVLQHEA